MRTRKVKRLVFASKDFEGYLNELGFERITGIPHSKKIVPFHYVANKRTGKPILHIQENRRSQGQPHERLFGTVISDSGVYELNYGRKDFDKVIRILKGYTEEV